MASIEPGLRPLIEMAVADLAERLRVEPATISVLSAELVTWPDPGLGRYPELKQRALPVDGSEIILGRGTERYSYRTGGRVITPVLVDRPDTN